MMRLQTWLGKRKGWLVAVAAWAAAFGAEGAAVAEEAPDEQAAAAAETAKDAQADSQEYYEMFRLLADTLDQIERNSVKKIERRELVEAAIRGMLGKLDEHSNYVPPQKVDDFKTEVESEFGGIGIQVAIQNSLLTVLSPIVGSPAYRAGIHAGDQIVKIDSKSAEGITIDEAIRKLKGVPGTKVAVAVRRPADESEHEFTLEREVIRVETVMGDLRKEDYHWDYMLDDERKIGYLRITAFSRHTPGELRAALDELTRRGMKGLVIDLRFNPGGLLSSAIEISDLFISRGRIVSTEGRNVPRRAWDARRRGTYEGFPIAILVNNFSASASEIVSACLQDHGRAKVIGERTWGKGSVQNVIELEEGRSILKLTTASYLRPSGKNIHRFAEAKESDEWGVRPDEGFEVKMTPAQRSQYLRYRRDRDLQRPGQEKEEAAEPKEASKPAEESSKPAEEATEEAKPEQDEKPRSEGRRFVDPQLKSALDYLKSQLEGMAENKSEDVARAPAEE